jgi:transcriptional regulator with XRE-family HTH domain
MRRDVQARIRKRIRDRLDDLRMTGRELAKACGHGDAWISNILSGRDGLHWKDFDAVAAKLKLSPAELVRHDEDELRELTPTEMRLLRHFQNWPDPIKDRWLEVLDFFSSAAPDKETALFLTLLRDTPRSLRGPTMRWLEGLLQEGIPPAYIAGVVGLGTAGATTPAKRTKRPARSAGRSHGSHDDGDGLRTNRNR